MEPVYRAITESEGGFSFVKEAFLKMIGAGFLKESCWEIVYSLFSAVEIKDKRIKSIEEAEDIIELSSDSEKRAIAVDYIWFYAMAGNGQAMYVLGECYKNGNGVDKNNELAYEWFTNSSNNNNSNGMVAVGLCYENGICVNKDNNKAIEYYEKAAEYENGKAYGRLGELLSGEKAEFYVQKALECGDVSTVTHQLFKRHI